jgi:hypothetical protein
MAKNREVQDNGELVDVEFRRPTTVGGVYQPTGSTAEVAAFQKRHLVDAGYVDGTIEDIASPAEIEQGCLDVLKADEREPEYDAPVEVNQEEE